MPARANGWPGGNFSLSELLVSGARHASLTAEPYGPWGGTMSKSGIEKIALFLLLALTLYVAGSGSV